MKNNLKNCTQEQLIAETLKKHKLKVTSQRVAIYSFLLNCKEHPTAEKVYLSLKTSNPNLSLGTVYKTLETFKTLGLIQGFNLGETKFRYDGNMEPHTHFYCNHCENVYDIYAKPMFINSELENFEVENFQGFLYGTCKNCK